MQFLRLWKERENEKLQLAEEIRIFLKQLILIGIMREQREILNFLAPLFAYAHAGVPEWPNGTGLG